MIWLALVAGCGKGVVALPTPAAEPPPFPTGWWTTKNYAARFDADGYVLIGKDGTSDRRICGWEWRKTHWSCLERPDDLLFWTGEEIAYGIAAKVDLFEPAEDAAPYQAAAAELPDPRVICRLAESCCRALPNLAYDCDGLAIGSSLFVCRYALEHLRNEVGAAAPPQCAQ